MKLVKNITIIACVGSFMFAGVGFHMGNNYSELDDATAITKSYGMTWALNGTTGIGIDSVTGMMMYFSVPAGITFRMGWNGAGDGSTSLGLGYTWWSGGEGLKTSIGTAYDYVRTGGANPEDNNNLAVVVGFGF